jgi:hypothetical protein
VAAEIEQGARLVVYTFVVSVVIMSFKRSPGVKLVRAGENRALKGLPYTLISLLAGWWGIPWGPFWTVKGDRQQHAGRDGRNGRLPQVARLISPPRVRVWAI